MVAYFFSFRGLNGRIIGIVIAGFIFLANITSISSFGKPFMIPYAPLIKKMLVMVLY
jgi:hypothetical protein